jgi:prephenate dehydratase
VGLWYLLHRIIRAGNLHELGVVMARISGNADGVTRYYIIGKKAPMMMKVKPKVNFTGRVIETS